ncbi:MAG: MBOAT family O-acyltransferase [Candidatus Sungiibacteriota bacterium]
MVFNYWLGNLLAKHHEKEAINGISRRFLLLGGIAVNTASLFYFKYADFFIENINFIFNSNVPLLHILLPLGISFFTFQEIAYLVDSYYGETKEYNFTNYALFVTFFPQLIAGPIVHHKEMMAQFETKKNLAINFDNIAVGIFFFAAGLFKKVVIADTFAVWATSGFDASSTPIGFFAAWATSLSYTFQLYFDFSGYTDMAIGAARMFNITLPLNFNSPYKALDIQDFWKRWHMTLSRFWKNYLYVPLGGNRSGFLRMCANLFLVFLIGGIWHGAGWTFFIWGAMHGAAMVIFRCWKKLGMAMPRFWAWFLTFNFINAAWIFFRANTLSDAVRIVRGMAGLNGIEFFVWPGMTALWIAVFLLVVVLTKNTHELAQKFKPNFYYLAAVFVLFMVSLYNLGNYSEFIYFRF